MNNRQKGFTVAELILAVFVLGFASILFFVQKQNIQSVANDDKRKIAINAIYYSLEEVFYEENGYYPQTISSEVLRSVDPNLFADPDGVEIGTSGSSYSYAPTDCEDNKCTGYTLKTTLENEADYIKTNEN